MIFNFPALIVQSIWQLTFKWSWFFKKKGGKNPKHPLSAFQTSKIIVNVVVRISHAKAVSRAASLQQLSVCMAMGEVWVQERTRWLVGVLDIALQAASAPKWHFWNKFLHLFLHCWGHFTSLLLKSEDGSKCYTGNLLSHTVHMGISQEHFQQPRDISAECWSEKRTFCHPETAAAGPSAWHHSTYFQRAKPHKDYLNKPKEMGGSKKQVFLWLESGVTWLNCR